MTFKQFLEGELIKKGYKNYTYRNLKNWQNILDEDTAINTIIKSIIEWEEMKSKEPQEAKQPKSE